MRMARAAAAAAATAVPTAPLRYMYTHEGDGVHKQRRQLPRRLTLALSPSFSPSPLSPSLTLTLALTLLLSAPPPSSCRCPPSCRTVHVHIPVNFTEWAHRPPPPHLPRYPVGRNTTTLPPFWYEKEGAGAIKNSGFLKHLLPQKQRAVGASDVEKKREDLLVMF